MQTLLILCVLAAAPAPSSLSSSAASGAAKAPASAAKAKAKAKRKAPAPKWTAPTLEMRSAIAPVDQRTDAIALLVSARKVARSERDDAWKQRVKSAARAVASAHTSAESRYFDSQWLLRRYRFLKNDRAFMDARADATLAAAERCYAQSARDAGCNAMLTTLLTTDGSRAVALRTGQLIARRHDTTAALAAFRQASSDGATGCDDATLRRAVQAGMALPGDDERGRAAREIEVTCRK